MAESEFDVSKPFQGVVVCCTSIPPDQRTDIANTTAEMGGVHKYDLTPDVTHLIVGEYNTPKYRHVAKERPDIIPMAAGWIQAMRHLWMEDQEIDFAALEEEWRLKTFETSGEGNRRRLLCCLTGFEDAETRANIEEKVTANGGEWTGDLSKKVTHLIVFRPEGKKYAAAKNWGVQTVSLEWLDDSIERRMILEESCYDPVLSKEERGQGAWVRRHIKRDRLGKRLRGGNVSSVDEGRRKLRKTASMKLMDQRDNLWGDILVKNSASDLSKLQPALERTVSAPAPMPAKPRVPFESTPSPDTANESTQADGPIFSSCRFFIHGFDKRRTAIVCEHLVSHGGQIASSLPDVASPEHPEPADQRFLIVPQSSQPDSHPQLPETVHIVTEFYVERCIHNRQLFHPNEHALGRPFPQFPVQGFQDLSICTAGFKNEQLNQVEKSIIQLGARYTERLNAQTSLLVCPSISDVRKQKLDFAVSSKVPVVDAEWLWQCIITGFCVPWENFLCKGLLQDLSPKETRNGQQEKAKLQRSRSEPMAQAVRPESRAPPANAGVDRTAFADEEPARKVPSVQRQETHDSHYQTAPTHQEGTAERISVAQPPLSEKSHSALNKSPSPQRATSNSGSSAQRKLKRFPTGGTIGDSEDAADESDTPSISRPGTASGNAKAARDDEARRAEQEKQERTSRDKQELSKRLNSLFGASAESDTSAPDTAATAAGGTTTGTNASAPGRPQRRKREILGRAQSNVSAASTGSTESSAAAAHKSNSNNNSMNTSAEGGLTVAEDAPRPATQLDYDDPEAKSHRAALMERMLGGAGGNNNNTTKGGMPPMQQQERTKLSDLSATSFDAIGGPGTRTRRKKGF